MTCRPFALFSNCVLHVALVLAVALLCRAREQEVYASGWTPSTEEDNFRKAVKLEPTSVPAWHGLTALLMKEERHAEAADGWGRITRLNPSSGSAWANRGVMLIRSTQDSPTRAHDAVSCLHQAHVLEPQNPQRKVFLDKAVTWRKQVLAAAREKGIRDECGNDDNLVRQKTAFLFMRCSDAVMFGACLDVLLPKASAQGATFNVRHACPLACGLCPDYYPPVKVLAQQRLRSELKKKVKVSAKIAGFMHVGTFGRWETVVGRQLTKLVESGLYDASEQISVGVVGGKEWEPPTNLPKIEVITRVADANAYEVPTLTKLHEYCQKHVDHFVFYIHSKGATSMEIQDSNIADPAAVWDWREYMEYFVIERYADCVQALQTGSNTCGVNYSPQPPHYSGNFWWARCSCVAELPAVQVHDRLLAEKWLLQPAGSCLARAKVRNMWYSGLYDNERGSGHYIARYPPARYENQTCAHFSCQDPPIPQQ
jgi:hypothetical protein